MPIVDKSEFAYGVDVSAHQANWVPSKKEAFIFIKATEGQSYVSPTLATQTKLARASGAVVGFYHFMWPSAKSGTPAVQAKFFVEKAKPQMGDLLVCDWEFVQGAGTPTEKDKDAFIAAVRKLAPGIKIGLYVNRSMWMISNKNKGDFLWLAEYAKNPTIDGWDFWQYTDTPLDRNIARFSNRKQLEDWITPTRPVSSKPVSTKPTSVTKEEAVEDIMPRLSDGDVKRIAEAVWNADVVPAPVVSKTNPTWKASSYLKNIYNNTKKK